jgi:flagellar motor switch protein FliN/FliY
MDGGSGVQNVSGGPANVAQGIGVSAYEGMAAAVPNDQQGAFMPGAAMAGAAMPGMVMSGANMPGVDQSGMAQSQYPYPPGGQAYPQGQQMNYAAPPPGYGQAPPGYYPYPPQAYMGQQAFYPQDRVATATYNYKTLEGQSMVIDQDNLDLVMTVPIQISVELGRTRRKIKDIADLGVGNIVELDRQAGDQVDVIANGKLIARGDVVVVDDNYSVRITEIIKQPEEFV